MKYDTYSINFSFFLRERVHWQKKSPKGENSYIMIARLCSFWSRNGIPWGFWRMGFFSVGDQFCSALAKFRWNHECH